MITLVVMRKGEQPERFHFTKPEVTLGRVQGNDIVLPYGNVSKRHARVVRKDSKYIIVDLKSTNGTYVNGRKITSPLVVRWSDKIYIGDFVISIDGGADEDAPTLPGVAVPYIPADATEQQLLDALVHGDDTSRDVYADWLEQRGDAERAEFLRLQQQIIATAATDPELAARTQRLRQLADRLPIPWRVQVARPVVERCPGVALDLQCPREWGSFQPTDDPSVRHCDTCRLSVHYCRTVIEARCHAQLGNCIAIDVRAARWQGDLDAPYDVHCRNCGVEMGDAARICPMCGLHAAPRLIVAGMPALTPH